MNQNIYDKLKQILSSAQVKADEPMKNHITFRVGGPADVYVLPKTKEELLQVITCCKAENVPYYIIGNGSNLLVGDKGYRGVVIQIFKEMNVFSCKQKTAYEITR